MENMGQNIFSKVDTRSERQRAYNLLLEEKGEVQVQLENKDLITCRPLILKDSRLVVNPVTRPKINSQEIVIVTFSIAQEKYFLKSTFHKEGHDFYYINIDNILYKLQRRNSFRVTIPIGYGARVSVNDINGVISNIKLPLADLSSGGFAFEITSQSVKLDKNDNIKGTILVGGKFHKPFEGIVRHVASYGSKGSGVTRLGVEFYNMPDADKEAFMKVTMELHRDMFSTFKIASR